MTINSLVALLLAVGLTGGMRAAAPWLAGDATFVVLGREVHVHDSGLLDSLPSAVAAHSRELLSAPMKLVVETPERLTWTATAPPILSRNGGVVAWEAQSGTGPFHLDCRGRVESDGRMNFQLTLVSAKAVHVRDVLLEIPLRQETVKSMTGLGWKWGPPPFPVWKGKWTPSPAEDPLWIGDSNGGVKFMELVPYRDWSNGGLGGCNVKREDGQVFIRAYSGPRDIAAGEELHFNFSLEVASGSGAPSASADGRTRQGAASTAKNVLLLISDNQSAADLGCYGNPQLKTPNLDALAAEGTRFPYAFCTSPSCGPSRAVIYTGLLTHFNGQYTHPHSFNNGVLAVGVTTVFDILKKAGYRTALLGKDNLGARAGQYVIDLQDREDDRNFMKLSAKAEKFIREGGDQPFFVVLATHDPLPLGGTLAFRKTHGVQPPRYFDPATVIVPPYLPDRPEVREETADYDEGVERLDVGYGRALEMLQRSGKAGSTLVIFTSDQGAGSFPNGAYSFYDPGVHVPMIIRNPEAKTRGVVCDAVVSLADVTPTVLDWTGVKPPYRLHGRSLLPVLEQTKTKAWDYVVLSHVMHEVTMYYPMRAIRERRYKLIWNLDFHAPWRDAIDVSREAVWRGILNSGSKFIGKRSLQKYIWRDQIELYDLQTDPDELVNLAYEAKYADIRRALSQTLLTRLRETGDNWLQRYELPMPGEEEHLGVMPPPGYYPVDPPAYPPPGFIKKSPPAGSEDYTSRLAALAPAPR